MRRLGRCLRQALSIYRGLADDCGVANCLSGYRAGGWRECGDYRGGRGLFCAERGSTIGGWGIVSGRRGT